MHLTRSLEGAGEGLDVMRHARQKIPSVKICAMSTDSSIASLEVMDYFVNKPIIDQETFLKALSHVAD